MYTIKDITEGKVSVKNDGTLEELKLVLKMANLDAITTCKGDCLFYGRKPSCSFVWYGFNALIGSLPTQSVKDFLTIPDKWCVKITDENREILLDWTYFRPGVHEFVTCLKHTIRQGQMHDYQEIPFELFKLKILNKMDYTITAKEMKELYDSIGTSCEWKDRIFSLYGRRMLSNEDCPISQELLDHARREASTGQLDLINRIFKPKYKEGDWVIFTEDYFSAFEIGDVKQIKINSFGKLLIDETFVYGLHNLPDYFKPAIPEEIERAQIKKGDLVWVKNRGDIHWCIRPATGEFEGSSIKTLSISNMVINHFQEYKKASQAVVYEYNSLDT